LLRLLTFESFHADGRLWRRGRSCLFGCRSAESGRVGRRGKQQTSTHAPDEEVQGCCRCGEEGGGGGTLVHLPLDSAKVKEQASGGDQTLYWALEINTSFPSRYSPCSGLCACPRVPFSACTTPFIFDAAAAFFCSAPAPDSQAKEENLLVKRNATASSPPSARH
jgi:hypothetical protein